mmetsp:Transcript_17622/g.68413  ORF Transcript_17622/g.68413 Transcript_17622/m.68413 type:complete len:127 (+) Transcript_17622:342-722(+)
MPLGGTYAAQAALIARLTPEQCNIQDAKKCTPLHNAIGCFEDSTVRALLAKLSQAQLLVPDKEGQNLLQVALGHPDTRHHYNEDPAIVEEIMNALPKECKTQAASDTTPAVQLAAECPLHALLSSS